MRAASNHKRRRGLQLARWPGAPVVRKATPNEGIDGALVELATAPKHFRVSYDEGVLFVWSRLERWRSKTDQCVRAVVKELQQVGAEHPLHRIWMDVYGAESWLTKATGRLGLSLDGASSEPQNMASQKGNPSLTPASAEAARKGKGKGPNREQGSQGEAEVDARPRSKRADPDVLPSPFPSEYAAVAEQVLSVLARCQAERGGNTPTLRGVGLAIAGHLDRDHAAAAADLEHWALAGTGQGRDIRDWTGTFRTFLQRSPAGTAPRTDTTPARPRSTYDHLIQRS
jgi:hypothetical protein